MLHTTEGVTRKADMRGALAWVAEQLWSIGTGSPPSSPVEPQRSTDDLPESYTLAGVGALRPEPHHAGEEQDDDGRDDGGREQHCIHRASSTAGDHAHIVPNADRSPAHVTEDQCDSQVRCL